METIRVVQKYILTTLFINFLLFYRFYHVECSFKNIKIIVFEPFLT